MKGFDPTDTNIDHGLTYNEWKNMGYHVRKGSKATAFGPDGLALFVPAQVEQNKTTRRSGFSESSTMWERSADASSRKGTPWGVVEDFDSFVREAGMMPDLSNRPRFAINDPLEMHFMNVADKHGILDAIIDGEYEDYY